ncbi:MAG: hypothetical protein ABIN97_03175 [Ginsengibacter sp.]
METTILREKLHTLIDNSTDDKLQAVFHLLQDEEYSDAFKSELDAEFASYQKEGESISKDEIDKIAEQLLQGKKS